MVVSFDLTVLDKLTSGHIPEFLVMVFLISLVPAFVPMVIAIVRGRRDMGPELLLSGILGWLAFSSILAFPAGLYLFYKNFQIALNAHTK